MGVRSDGVLEGQLHEVQREAADEAARKAAADAGEWQVVRLVDDSLDESTSDTEARRIASSPEA
ncbi:hypothetical protein [Streptomyces sp. IMTB 2501]|uniref:hypothetical protein n=1 Tax=Streptomyces sp. IMTB 2501 TaxID=1776340 RepID=UPI0011809D3D|nr:hypothetical protein [Streptomyces sp. IMTB 2501]